MKKYMLHPGYVPSKHDKDRHWVGSGQLAKLYGVDPCDCVTFREYYDPKDPNFVHLHPDYNGNYKMPSTNEL